MGLLLHLIMANTFNFNEQIEEIVLTTGNTLAVFEIHFNKIPNAQREAFFRDFNFRVKDDKWKTFIESRCFIDDGVEPHWAFRFAKEDVAICYDIYGRLLEDYREHQIEAIGYENWLVRKQKELKEVEEYISIVSKEFGIIPKRKIEPFCFQSNISKQRQLAFIKELYKHLKQYEFVNCEQKEFMALFAIENELTPKEVEAIYWKGDEKTLGYLILWIDPILDESKVWVKTSLCFYGKENKLFKSKQLLISANSAKKIPKRKQLIVNRLIKSINSKLNNIIPELIDSND